MEAWGRRENTCKRELMPQSKTELFSKHFNIYIIF